MDGIPDLEDHQELFVRARGTADGWILDQDGTVGLEDVIRNAGITVLIGTSAQTNRFDETVLTEMMKNTEQPVVFALSNPTSKCECLPEVFFRFTQGRGLMAVGSPFPPVKTEDGELKVSQGNNLYIFPGVGLGTLISGALKVTDRMFLQASYAIGSMMKDEDIRKGMLLPPLSTIREVSLEVAYSVAREARDTNIGTDMPDDELRERIRLAMWEPKYLPYRYRKSEK